MKGHTEAVTAVAFSPGGDLLASARTDGTVRLWEPATGKAHREPLEAQGGAVWSVACGLDGTLLVSAGTDQAVQLWDLRWWHRPPSAWAAVGCSLVNRNLSKAEWDEYAGGLSYQQTCPRLLIGEDAPDDAPVAEYSP